MNSSGLTLVGAALNVICAFFGGILIPVCQLIQLMKTNKPIPDLRSRELWLPFIIYPIPGVVLAIVYQLGNIGLSAIISFNLGLTGPAIVGNALKRAEEGHGETKPEQQKIEANLVLPTPEPAKETKSETRKALAE